MTDGISSSKSLILAAAMAITRYKIRVRVVLSLQAKGDQEVRVGISVGKKCRTES